MITVLTPTGGRPGAFALLAEQINAQSCEHFRWIVVDDFDPATPVPEMRTGIELVYVRPLWRWEPGQNTQSANLMTGLSLCRAEYKVIICEDDDAYSCEHVRDMAALLAKAPLVGVTPARYYNARSRRFREIPSDRHASLCATGLTGEAAFNALAAVAQLQKRIDIDLWGLWQDKKILTKGTSVVGIKGLPGRAGIGVGHRPDFGTHDPNGDILRAWIGQPLADRYLELASHD